MLFYIMNNLHIYHYYANILPKYCWFQSVTCLAQKLCIISCRHFNVFEKHENKNDDDAYICYLEIQLNFGKT